MAGIAGRTPLDRDLQGFSQILDGPALSRYGGRSVSHHLGHGLRVAAPFDHQEAP